MWGLLAGLVSYFPFARLCHNYLDDRGMPPGFSRKLLVFLLASALSSAVGYGVSALFTSPEKAQQDAEVQKKTMALLGNTLQCLQQPNNPRCAKNAQTAQDLLDQILGGNSHSQR
ncbi:MAG: hypothetical protein JJ693_05740 [Acidithiobacillus sp.]|nr:hypothetical protein [Acidithiobacillus sp.]